MECGYLHCVLLYFFR